MTTTITIGDVDLRFEFAGDIKTRHLSMLLSDGTIDPHYPEHPLIPGLHLCRMTSLGEMADIIGMPSGVWDYALPVDWMRQAMKDGIDTTRYVWLYDEHAPVFGRPFDVRAAFWHMTYQALIGEA